MAEPHDTGVDHQEQQALCKIVRDLCEAVTALEAAAKGEEVG